MKLNVISLSNFSYLKSDGLALEEEREKQRGGRGREREAKQEIGHRISIQFCHCIKLYSVVDFLFYTVEFT